MAKVQQGAAIAQSQAKGGPVLDAAGRRKKKEAEEKAARDLAALFAPVIKQPKPPPAAGPYTNFSTNRRRCSTPTDTDTQTHIH